VGDRRRHHASTAARVRACIYRRAVKAYAGIGSRQTPEEVLYLMTRAAEVLARQGWTLRSGHAPGADQAFEEGAGEHAEVYLPWPKFERDVPILGRAHPRPSPDAVAVAAGHHPGWQHLSPGARALHARNAHQVLGPDLRSPVTFVICWTPDGSLDGSGRDTGGTGQALRIAASAGITVFNLVLPEHRVRVEQMAGWAAEASDSPA
jgi:hypothetical protein